MTLTYKDVVEHFLSRSPWVETWTKEISASGQIFCIISLTWPDCVMASLLALVAILIGLIILPQNDKVVVPTAFPPPHLPLTSPYPPFYNDFGENSSVL